MARYTTIILIYILFTRILIFCSNRAPACFTWSPETITTKAPVKFNAACIEKASQFRWDFGDSSAIIITTSLTIDHLYSTPGVYSVTVTGKPLNTSSAGKTTVQTKIITVN